MMDSVATAERQVWHREPQYVEKTSVNQATTYLKSVITISVEIFSDLYRQKVTTNIVARTAPLRTYNFL